MYRKERINNTPASQRWCGKTTITCVHFCKDKLTGSLELKLHLFLTTVQNASTMDTEVITKLKLEELLSQVSSHAKLDADVEEAGMFFVSN
jgi:hypothetical protein